MAVTNLHPDWLVPEWPAPANVRAVFTTRSGGVSVAPFDSFNLGGHVGDSAAAVQANRARFVEAVQAKPGFMQQVHGTAVHSWHGAEPVDCVPVADACTSTQAGLACTVMVADCLPVLFTTTNGSVVAAAHAGWRGLCNGVLEATLQEISRLRHAGYAVTATKNVANDVNHEVLAWLGPCIGPSAFEVGAEVRDAFLRQSASPEQTAKLFRACMPGKYLANLPSLARERLLAAGVTRTYGNDGSLPWCTVSDAKRYFSHRRDAQRLGSSGRMAASVWRVPD